MSIQAVAEKAKVSAATVSRVFNFPDKVKPLTRARVERAAQQLGYLPNASARSLRTQRSRVLGVVLPTLLNPVFAECLEGIAQAATAAGYSIMPITTQYQLDREERAVNLLLAGSVDALILVVSNPSTSLALKKLSATETPYVLAYNQHAAHPCVYVDSQRAVGELVVKLSTLGHRHIAMVSGELAASDRSQQRYRGFVKGIKAAKLKLNPLIEVPFVEAATEQLCQVLQGKHRPTALVCSNDLLAIRTLRAAHLSGLQVPKNLTVTGFDGIALGLDITPVLSTITQPNHDIGRCSVELIVQALASGTALKAASSVRLDFAFREGQSCAKAA
jgi:DNA-binding LacI/PurR family transcriptional regulator